MRTTPGAGPAAIKRQQWADLAGRYTDHAHDKQLRKDQRDVWIEMMCQEVEAGKTCGVVGREYNCCRSTVSRLKREHDRKTNNHRNN